MFCTECETLLCKIVFIIIIIFIVAVADVCMFYKEQPPRETMKEKGLQIISKKI